MSQVQRESILTEGLNLSKPGLEISPLYRPTVRKSEHYVFYTDYCTAEESRKKHSSYDHDEIMEIDFVWTPGKRLSECVGSRNRFSWATSSHVMEHVPNPIGWPLEVLEVLEAGATFSLALPDKRYCFDRFRRETDAADLIDSWVRNQSIPSPYQLFDFLSRSVDGSGEYGKRAFDTANRFEEAKRTYTDAEALNFVRHSWVTGSYIDAHCSAFTPLSFVEVFNQINALGVLNIEISEPVMGHEEFFVNIMKIGEPSVGHPGSPNPAALGAILGNFDTSRDKDLEHARNAFLEAVQVQNELKSQLEKRGSLRSWVLKRFSSLISK